MKRILTTLIITVAIMILIWMLIPPMLQKEAVKATLISPKRQTVYETISCTGNTVSKNVDRMKIGVPAQIVAVYHGEGDTIEAGELILRYKPLQNSISSEALAGIIYSEIFSNIGNMYSDFDEEQILTAAKVYAQTGRIPDYFKDFYLTDSKISAHDGNLYASISGTVTKINCTVGDIVSGVFTSAVIADEELEAEVNIPEQYLSRIRVGQDVSLYSGARSGVYFSGRLREIDTSAKTVGGLISNAETVIGCRIEIDNCDSLIPGLAVKARINCGVYENAIVIPYSAIEQDENGAEYVYRYENGYVKKEYLNSVYENDDGVVVESGFTENDLIVEHPSEDLADGMAVMAEMTGQSE